LNNLYFIIGHGKTRRRKDVSQILYQLRVEFVFLCFGIKTSFVEMLKYFLNVPVMFGHVVWVNEYNIQIDHNTDIQKIREKVIHKLIKSYRSIGKTKEHYRPLEWSVTCPKSSLSFITVSYVHTVVSMVEIYLCIYLSFARWVQ